MRILGNSNARGLLVGELSELEAFLAERSWELAEIEKGQQQQNTNVKLLYNSEETRSFHSKVAEAIESMSGKDVQPLLMMSSGDATMRNTISELSAQKALSE